MRKFILKFNQHFKHKLNSHGAGFTLIELLTVVAIIGVLATVLISAINPIAQIQRSRDTQRKADMHQIQSALELYRSDCGQYPLADASNILPSPLKGCPGVMGTTYMERVPKTPQGIDYYYQNVGSINKYQVWACLELASDQSPGTFQHDPCVSTARDFTGTNRAFAVDSP